MKRLVRRPWQTARVIVSHDRDHLESAWYRPSICLGVIATDVDDERVLPAPAT